jgi:hypothetical protein
MRDFSGLAAIAAIALLTGCAGIGGGPSSASRSEVAGEKFNYAPAQNGAIRVSVDEVRMRGDRGFLPNDANWLQLRVTVANVGKRTVSFRDFRAKLDNGKVIAAADTIDELAKMPSAGKTMGRMAALGIGGQVIGAMLFPPLALVASGANVAGITKDADDWQKRARSIDAEILKPQDIAPGTSVSGDVYIPAVRGQTGLIAFYQTGGRSESLNIARTR